MQGYSIPIMQEQSKCIPQFADQHYSVSQVAEKWGLSDDSIRRIFEKEPDVLILANRARGSRRVKRTLRIPAHVVERVHKRMSTAA